MKVYRAVGSSIHEGGDGCDSLPSPCEKVVYLVDAEAAIEAARKQ